MATTTADPYAGATGRDRLLGGRVQLWQPLAGYRAAIDPVLLAAAVPARPGEAVLDLGCGAGAAFLCLAARVPDLRVTGLERDPEAAALARRNAAENGVAATILAGSVAPPPAALPRDSFRQVLANPPYLAPDRGTAPAPGRLGAHQEDETPLTAWTGLARRALVGGGCLTLIHRADRLDDVLRALEGFGQITLLPLWPHAGEPARRIIVTARKDRRGPAALLPGLVLHHPDGRYTEETAALLEGRAALT